MNEIPDINFLTLPLSTWFLAVAIAAGGILAAWLVRWIASAIVRRAIKQKNEEATSIDEASHPHLFFTTRIIRSFIFPVIIIAGVYSASTVFELQGGVNKLISGVFVIIFSLISIRFFVTIVNGFFNRAAQKENHGSFSRYRPLRSIAIAMIWIIGILFLLSNLGFDITTVVAGLGIGGIAIALAGQVILGDLFSYFVIIFDRPFELGDFLIFGDVLGTVEKIGVKTTRIRSNSGEQVIISNTDLTDSRVRNFKRMERRRVVFKIGVVYGTNAEAVREIPAIIKHIIEQEEFTAFDRAHFAGYGDWSLIYEVVYFVSPPDYGLYMDTQQRINLAIYDEFSTRGIQFAFPTQTIMIPKEK